MWEEFHSLRHLQWGGTRCRLGFPHAYIHSCLWAEKKLRIWMTHIENKELPCTSMALAMRWWKKRGSGWTWGNGASSPMSWVCWWPMECSHRPRDWNRLNAGRLWEPCQQDKVEDLPRRRSLQNGKCTMHAETYLLWRPNSKQTSPSGILILIGSQDRWCKIRSFSWYSSVVTGNMVI